MGTQAFYFVRCHGRYFVYHNQFDSYPEGLGEAIVNKVPEDPDKYQEWLQASRGVYARLVEQLKTHALPIIVQTSQEEDSPIALRERYERSFLAIDDQLELPPLQTIFPGSSPWDIDWTYILDLDREVLTVDHSLHLHLSKIPRGAAWIKYLGVDPRRRRTTSDFTPAGLVANLAWKPEINSDHLDMVRQFDIKVESPEVFHGQQDVPSAREFFLNAIFMYVHKKYRCALDASVLEWDPGCFSFREIAFSVLSIASGELSFEFVQNLDPNHQAEGYYLKWSHVCPDLNAPDNLATVLPRFLFESHLPGFRSGSAPEGRAYWLKGVLIYLTSRLDLVEAEEAAVAEAVGAGLKLGLKDFHAMVFSILDVVLLRVQKDTNAHGTVHVHRSPLMALFQFDDRNSQFTDGPRTRAPTPRVQEPSSSSYELIDSPEDMRPSPWDPEDTYTGSWSPQDEVEEREEASRTENEAPGLEHEDASNTLDEATASTESEEAVVTELQEESEPNNSSSHSIISNDTETYHDNASDPPRSTINADTAFVMVSRFFNAATSRSLEDAASGVFPNEILETVMQFSDTQTYRKLAAVSAYCQRVSTREFRLNDEYAVIGFNHDKSRFTLKNLSTGNTFQSQMNSYSSNGDELRLCPVIGMADSARRSILDSVHLYFSEAVSKAPRYTKRIEMPKREYLCHNPYLPGSQRLFNVPDHMYVGSIEESWGKYLTSIVQKDSSTRPFSTYFQLRRPKFPCLLPPRLRELILDHFNCNGLHCFIRHRHDESAEEWDLTIEHAARELHTQEIWRLADNAQVRGRPVLVAFSTRIRFFYYVHHCVEAPPIATDARPHCVEIASRCTEPEPRRRLVPLIAGGEIVDLTNKESRDEFESWIIMFCGNKGMLTEYDPFTEKQLPLIPDPSKSRHSTAAT
ncbi:hypothetical protein BO71DRAFT_369848 [Aspergillus ellipticus CBS 707.79]|uniref:Uncharacterized protein n=1 Tax=Aspergillus ellipticus CBS 707.79 TaxID=1448320 RepID=A0A319EEA9_9EURO|nr:hypothetical protein BO71DRAFT_369848 [Aspergillus ellipticus CBS 707.79]